MALSGGIGGACGLMHVPIVYRKTRRARRHNKHTEWQCECGRWHRVRVRAYARTQQGVACPSCGDDGIAR